MTKNLLLALISLLLCPTVVKAQAHYQDSVNLVTFYYATGGPNWTNPWDLSKPVKDWEGVTLKASDGRLLSLKITRNNLTGEVPAVLGTFTEMVSLNIGGNKLTGNLPVSIGSLEKLESISLFENDLDAPLPKALGQLKKLRSLSLEYNNIPGPLPDELGGMESLKLLNISYNELTGPIPDSIGQLTKLTSLKLNRNNLEGELPNSLGYLTNLFTLRVDKNPNLSGSLPFSITNISGLTFFFFSETSICTPPDEAIHEWLNSIYSVIGTNLTCDTLTCIKNDSLALLDLYHATDGANWRNPWDLTQPISQWEGVTRNNVTGCVEALELDYQRLDGQFPEAIFQLNQLVKLNLSNNSLSGTLPLELWGMTQLTQLDLGGNDFSGTIPSNIKNLKNLKTLDLSGRTFLPSGGFSGSIPLEISQLTQLSSLSLSYNELSGNIPESLGQMTNLVSLKLASNKFSGCIPTELGQLTQLKYLYLFQNNLSCPLDASIGNLKELIELKLFENNLSGQIPEGFWLLDKLELVQLEFNKLEGTLPTEVENMKSLRRLHLYNNQLTGEIPNSIGQLGNLRALKLENNMLSGDFPSNTTQLTELLELAVNNNTDLAGSIPLGIINLTKIYEFDFGGTQICEPQHPLFTQWSDSFYSYYNSGISCDLLPAIERDSTSLLGIYYATNGANWHMKWDLTQPMSEWHGVQLNDDGTVKALTLPNNNLEGYLPPEAGYLSALETLNLSHNSLGRNLPLSIRNLKKLKTIELNNNQINGWIPIGIGSFEELNTILLQKNDFEGVIPVSFSGLPNLTFLNVSSNPNLVGSIPKAFTELQNLTNFQFHQTGICEPGDSLVQSWLESIPNMNGTEISCETLSAAENDKIILLAFYSAINAALNLRHLNWSITRPISEWYYITINSAQRVTSMNVEDYGYHHEDDIPAVKVPVEFAKLDQLEEMNFYGIRFVGSLPVEWGDLIQLKRIELSNGYLISGEIPLSFTNLTNLASFFISRNDNLCKPDDPNFVLWEQSINSTNLDDISLCAPGNTRIQSSTQVTSKFALFQNVPNPTKDNTKIGFYLPEGAKAVSLTILDPAGKIVAESVGSYEKGYQEILLNTHKLKQGIYFYTLSSPHGQQTKRLIITK